MKSGHKIALLIDSLASGGAQRQIILLGNQLVLSGFEVSLLTYHDCTDLKYLVRDEIEYYCIDKEQTNSLHFLYRFYKHLKSIKPQSIIAYLHTPSLMARVIGRFAGVENIITSERNSDLRPRGTRFLLERLTYQLSSVIVTNSFCTQDRLQALLPGSTSRLRVIYNAVDHVAFSSGSKVERVNARNELGLGAGEFVFLLPGRLVKQKGHLVLTRAAMALADSFPFKLLFVGNEIDKTLKEALMQEMKDSSLESRVAFLGYQQDMRTAYCLSDVVVLPSLWEGLPNVLLEAMACERPVIASDVGDNAALVKPERGLLVEPDDVEGLRDAMITMMTRTEADLDAMGKNGRQYTTSTCSVDEYTAKYVALIQGK